MCAPCRRRKTKPLRCDQAEEVMTYPLLKIIIRDTKTGESRLYEHPDFDAQDGKPFCGFIWGDGNYAADCNRYLFFCKAIGNERDDEIETDGLRFVIDGIYQNGLMVYQDAETPNQPNSV